MSDTPLTDAAKEGGESWMELAALSAVLERENAALRADRDRLDWLSKHVTYFSPASEEEGWCVQFRTPVLRMNCKSNELTNVRQAIDAAMESNL